MGVGVGVLCVCFTTVKVTVALRVLVEVGTKTLVPTKVRLLGVWKTISVRVVFLPFQIPVTVVVDAEPTLLLTLSAMAATEIATPSSPVLVVLGNGGSSFTEGRRRTRLLGASVIRRREADRVAVLLSVRVRAVAFLTGSTPAIVTVSL